MTLTLPAGGPPVKRPGARDRIRAPCRFANYLVPGAFEFTPVQHGDDRGLFLEWFKIEKLVEAVGHPLTLAQANLSVSRAATLRGVHFADVPPGQAKYVTCPRGAVLDFMVDVGWARRPSARSTSSGSIPSTGARSTSPRASAMRSWPWRTIRR